MLPLFLLLCRVMVLQRTAGIRGFCRSTTNLILKDKISINLQRQAKPELAKFRCIPLLAELIKGVFIMAEDVFFPNNLTKEESEKLSGWKLKVAALHFGAARGDCVHFGYGYGLKYSPKFDKKTIHLLADRDGRQEPAICLGDEIDWDDPSELLREIGVSYTDLLVKHVVDSVNS